MGPGPAVIRPKPADRGLLLLIVLCTPRPSAPRPRTRSVDMAAVAAGLLTMRLLLPVAPRGDGLRVPLAPSLTAVPSLIHSAEAVNVSWSGITPGPTDFIVASYNTSAGVGAFDFCAFDTPLSVPRLNSSSS
jgi:hypothetical protein